MFAVNAPCYLQPIGRSTFFAFCCVERHQTHSARGARFVSANVVFWPMNSMVTRPQKVETWRWLSPFVASGRQVGVIQGTAAATEGKSLCLAFFFDVEYLRSLTKQFALSLFWGADQLRILQTHLRILWSCSFAWLAIRVFVSSHTPPVLS